MKLLDYFRNHFGSNKNSANLAKERLQIIVAHQNSKEPYIPQLQAEIISVIEKYIPINKEQIKISLDNNDDLSILELNITLPNAIN